MNILATADLHINIGNRFEDTKTVLRQIVKVAVDKNCKQVCILGDVYERKRPYNSERVLFHKFVKALADLNIEVIIISGNHDTDQFNVSALDEFGVLDLPNVKLLPNPSVIKMLTSTIYLGHFLVTGAKLGASDYVARDSVNIETILKTKADLYLLGDVHKAQKLHTNPDVLYIGSPERTTFGERLEEKGVVIISDSELDSVRYTFHPLITRKMIQLENNGGGFQSPMPDTEDAIVKIVFNVTEEQYKLVNEKQIREEIVPNAYSVKFEYNVSKKDRVRKSNISEGTTPLKAFEEYAKSVEFDDALINLGKLIIGKA